MVEFVNPYTFVPHVPDPKREVPYGHARMGPDRFSGVLKVKVTARTPLVIGGYAKDDETPDVPRRKSGEAMIPGTGFLGAIRSVHEAVTGSCLRVLATDWVPVHRHPANELQTKNMKLAVVDKIDEATGRPLRVRLCDRTEKIEAANMPRPHGELPRTGDQLSYDPEERSAEFIHRMRPVERDCWVLLITSTMARTKNPLRFYVGAVGTDSRAVEVPEDTWKTYLRVVQDAGDLRTGVLAKRGYPGGKEPRWGTANDPDFDVVTWPTSSENAVAERLCARSGFYEGQPVWVEVREEQVTEIRLSLLWRYEGSKPIGERAGKATPCGGPELCWSCRVFGSADTSGREADERAVQLGYRGHVRVDDLLAVTEVPRLTLDLAPLVTPHPSAGQFYLDNTHATGTKGLANPKLELPAAAWGSKADSPEKRRVRGRKFYWRTDQDPSTGNVPRGRKRSNNSDAVSRTAALIPAGTVFEGNVYFDNLGLEDYGSLLVALDPRLLAHADDPGWRDTVTSVGGAKPFGFGSVTADIMEVRPQTARQRYLGESGSVPEVATVVHAFREAVDSKAHGEWRRLRNALTFGYVRDDLVWYPAGGEKRGTKEYDESFKFFAATNGVQLSQEKRPLKNLPDPAKSPDDQVISWEPRRGNRGK